MSDSAVEPEALVETFGALLGGDKPKHASNLAKKLRTRTIEPGGVVCEAGSTSDTLCLIREGSFTVSIGSGKRKQEVARLFPGNWFGELGMVAPGNGTAEVRAIGASEILELTHEGFMELTSEDPVLARAILHQFDQTLLERILRARNVDPAPEPSRSYFARLLGGLFGRGDAS